MRECSADTGLVSLISTSFLDGCGSADTGLVSLIDEGVLIPALVSWMDAAVLILG